MVRKYQPIISTACATIHRITRAEVCTYIESDRSLKERSCNSLKKHGSTSPESVKTAKLAENEAATRVCTVNISRGIFMLDSGLYVSRENKLERDSRAHMFARPINRPAYGSLLRPLCTRKTVHAYSRDKHCTKREKERKLVAPLLFDRARPNWPFWLYVRISLRFN